MIMRAKVILYHPLHPLYSLSNERLLFSLKKKKKRNRIRIDPFEKIKMKKSREGKISLFHPLDGWESLDGFASKLSRGQRGSSTPRSPELERLRHLFPRVQRCHSLEKHGRRSCPSSTFFDSIRTTLTFLRSAERGKRWRPPPRGSTTPPPDPGR